MYKILIVSVVMLLLVSCSTKKNTAASRGYHQMTTRYNIYFNADLSYKEGVKAINDGNVDDFSKTLPMFAISNKENQTKATSQMDKTIEKCRKAIKKHSITKKPKRNKKKWKDPKYKAFYNQKEFVKGVKESWITLGQAEYHKGDFIGAIGTFSYIIRHYPNDAYVQCESKVWLARAYAEQGWLYEAEEAFEKINENDVHRKLTGDYAATKADILMKQKKNAEAYPYLVVAANNEKNRAQRTRFYYILGQIAMEMGEKGDAAEWFAKVKKSTPPYLMDFNTKLNLYSAQSAQKSKAVKGLEKMARQANNLEYLDQVYHTLGDVYLANGDTLEAIEAYEKGAIESTRNGKDKAALLIATGDLYLLMKNYVDAHPCFQEASTIIDASHEDYARVEKLGTVLGDVAVNYNAVELQDSLQHLATLTETEQITIIEKVIEQVIADEKEAEELAAAAAKKASTLNRRAANQNSMMPPMGLGATQNRDWYFYNDNLKQKGNAQFQQRWGKRKIEDNWRRSVKTSSSFDSEDGDAGSGDGQIAGTSNNTLSKGSINGTVDNKDPLFYMAQIPKTEEDIEASNEEIAAALYKLGEVYSTQLEDAEAGLAAYEDFVMRFPGDTLLIEVYYACYRLCGQLEDFDKQEQYKQLIINNYPNSTYAMMLSRPDYVDRMKAMFAEQDSIYEYTYELYARGDFGGVRAKYVMMQEKYPLSELMPKFALLNALCIGRTKQDVEMFNALTEITEKYPNSDVAPMCKDILALMNQGQQAQKGAQSTNLTNKRQQEQQTQVVDSTEVLEYVYEETADYEFHIIPKNGSDTVLNTLLYNVALFNFTKFLVKNYDIAKETIDGHKSICIKGMTTHKEAMWYESMLLAEPMLQGLITLDVCERLIITGDNAKKILKGLTLDEYRLFYQKVIVR